MSHLHAAPSIGRSTQRCQIFLATELRQVYHKRLRAYYYYGSNENVTRYDLMETFRSPMEARSAVNLKHCCTTLWKPR